LRRLVANAGFNKLMSRVRGFYIDGADVRVQYLLTCGKQGSQPANLLGRSITRRVAGRVLVYTEARAVALRKRARLRADSICSSEVVHDSRS
jgi:hypothetical protein